MPKKIKLRQRDIELIVNDIINEQVTDETGIQFDKGDESELTDVSNAPVAGEKIAVAYMQPETKKVILVNPKTKEIYLTIST